VPFANFPDAPADLVVNAWFHTVTAACRRWPGEWV
jgi:hypothetical protein